MNKEDLQIPFHWSHYPISGVDNFPHFMNSDYVDFAAAVSNFSP